jgi:hypothetical protein
MSYSTMAEQGNLYVDFVGSEEWNDYLIKIRAISPAVADAINKYGIGEKICDDGQYDFESGQLLDCIPSSDKRELEEDIESCYNLICSLAKAYAEYAVENA